MKRIKKYVTMALIGVTVLSFTGCNMIQRTEESIKNTVYAKVGNVKITKGEVDEALKTYLDQYRTYYGDDFESNSELTETLKNLRTQQLEGLIDQEVLLQNKEAIGVNPTDEEIQAEVDERIQYYKDALGTEEEYQSFIESYGYDDASFEEFWKEQVVVGMLVDKIVEGVEVTDEEIQTYYNENIDTYTTKPGADVTHILFQTETDDDGNVTEESDASAKALADAAREKALSGMSLQEIAESDEFKDSATFEELGRVSFEDSGMVQEFEDAFKVLPANQVSDVVKTSYGYHVIVNTAVYPDAEVQALDDTLKEEIKSTLLTQKQQEVYEAKLQELKDGMTIKTYENRI